MAKPKVGDYNRDGVVDKADDALAPADVNNDGRVTRKERLNYEKNNPTPTAESYGFNDAYLNEHPDIRDLIAQAIAGRWDEAKWNAEFEKTPTGIATTDAEAAFDIGIMGQKAEDLQNRLRQTEEELRTQAQQLGIPLSDADITAFARNTVRSNLNTRDVLGLMAGRVQTATPAKQRTGQVADIVSSLESMAREYGITITPDYVQQQAQEAVRQGGDWQSYIENQRNVFREQAKLLYPTIADKFDKYTLNQVVDPYLNDASNLLGINRENMNLDDPMWTAALNGPNGPMSRDEWLTKLKTDPQYGFDKTIKARNEYMGLANNILAAFGMA